MKIRMSVGIAAFAALSLSGCASKAESREDAALDVVDLWQAVATYYVDHTDDPTVTYADGSYEVAGQSIEARLAQPVLTFTANGPDDWCVTIEYRGGAAAVSEGSDWVLRDSANC
jgi:outer membrane murein-binding lipoprotein Lpp